nr:MAG TPA: DNA polymerase B [Caudoviricetes sp.]
MGDFETTVFDNQTYTEVWAAAMVPFWTEEVSILHSIDDMFNKLKNLYGNICIFFHNLKFDGSFWIPFLEQTLKLQQAYMVLEKDGQKTYRWIEQKYMQNNTYKYMISDRGQWYNIIIKVNNKFIEIRDSLKLLPFSVEEIGRSFKTKHKKLTMEYKGVRYAGCEITDEEKEYIANDVLVVKEALEIMFNEGHNGVTIGSCCLKEFKKTYDKWDYQIFFPNLYDMKIDEEYGAPTAGDYVRKAYRGGWCYLVPEKAGWIHKDGLTADVNSLYPSMMSSQSGNRYPVGKPTFWKGDYIPEQARKPGRYYFVRVRTRFYLRKNYLPFIQLKNSFLYIGTENLTTSDVRDENGNYCETVEMPDGTLRSTAVTMTMTMTDWELFKKHYELVDTEILDGCWFFSKIGIFDEYIDKYAEMKKTSKGARRTLAKLFLNNLYGKEAASTDSSFKIAYVKEDGVIGFFPVKENAKAPGYIPCGAAITSYSRCFTITAAQQNYYGPNERGFIYADTDSIHCDLKPEEVKGITVHPTEFCCWKLESYWDEAIFTRQKTYIEHVTHEDGEPIETPFYDVKCAGMPKKSKQIFLDKMEADEYDLTDFKIGLKVEGKLTPKRIRGGVVLQETTYEMR